MKLLKFLALLVAIGVGAYLLLFLLGWVSALLWYAFWGGLLAIGAGVGYKLFLSGSGEDQPKLEEKKPTAISEIENADRALEEYKRKFLPEKE